jgi:hypothetical protein
MFALNPAAQKSFYDLVQQPRRRYVKKTLKSVLQKICFFYGGKMRKIMKTVAAQSALVMLFLVPQVAGATDYTQEQILKEFEYLKQKVQSQQEDIERLQSVIDETMDRQKDRRQG